MSTHSFIFRRRWSKSLSVFSILAGLLMALQLVLLPLSSVSAAPASHLSDAPKQNLARAGVSIVRLVVSYTVTKQPAGQPPQVLQCSGLGTLVASWPSQGKGTTDQNNWILSDGYLVDASSNVICGGETTPTTATLSSVEILLSNTYNTQPVSIPLTTIDPKNVHCQAKPCNKGSVLFSFHTDPTQVLPFVDIATTPPTRQTRISLQSSSPINTLKSSATYTKQSQKQQYEGQAGQFLIPSLISNSNSTSPEAGTPLVNDDGQLTGMFLHGNNTVDAQAIQSFKTTQLAAQLKGPLPSNPLHDQWNDGISAYYQMRYGDALTAFQTALGANPQFKGAQDFVNFSNAKGGKNLPPPTPSKKPTLPSGITLQGIFLPFWLLSIIGLIVLIVLFLLTSLLFGRSRLRRRALKAELTEADRKATIDAQRIAEMEATQQAHPEPFASSTPASEISSHAIANTPPLAGSELHCPHCNADMLAGSIYCPHCQSPLSPSEPELDRNMTPQAASAPQVVAVGAIADQPTVDMTPNTSKNGLAVPEQMVPPAKRQSSGKRLGLAVTARSNPGIKRGHKPNEDSLFAGQGVRDVDATTPQQLGLFVVADGMGGHANGQDASRMAIQTIVNYVLPKVWQNEELSNDAFAQLLMEGVQSANRAVHERNIEQQGDMGTTMTVAMVADTTAYVFNVGDSRTYLYREGEGLSKVTQDHSVVASLVEAGIIQPDDIYTHPKRNQIYRSLGEKPLVDIDSFVVPLQPGDKLLLCSDGLWEMVRDPKIETLIKGAPSRIDATGDALIQAALDGGGEDNVSIIVVQLAEIASRRKVKPGFQLLTKPDTVQMPTL